MSAYAARISHRVALPVRYSQSSAFNPMVIAKSSSDGPCLHPDVRYGDDFPIRAPRERAECQQARVAVALGIDHLATCIDVDAQAMRSEPDRSVVQQLAKDQLRRVVKVALGRSSVDDFVHPDATDHVAMAKPDGDGASLPGRSHPDDLAGDDFMIPSGLHRCDPVGDLGSQAVPVDVSPRSQVGQKAFPLFLEAPHPHGLLMRPQGIDRRPPAHFPRPLPHSRKQRRADIFGLVNFREPPLTAARACVRGSKPRLDRATIRPTEAPVFESYGDIDHRQPGAQDQHGIVRRQAGRGILRPWIGNIAALR